MNMTLTIQTYPPDKNLAPCRTKHKYTLKVTATLITKLWRLLIWAVSIGTDQFDDLDEDPVVGGGGHQLEK